jgi:hypothetical protein
MSIDEPASGSGAPESASLGELPAGSRRAIYARGLDRPRRSLVPWRNLRRAVFLILALMAVVALKRSAGGFFSHLLESVASPPAPPPAHTAPETTVHLQPGPPSK